MLAVGCFILLVAFLLASGIVTVDTSRLGVQAEAHVFPKLMNRTRVKRVKSR